MSGKPDLREGVVEAAGDDDAGGLTVSVVAGTPARQRLVTLRLPAGTVVREAVARSALLETFPEIDPGDLAYAVFGVRVEPGARVRDGDRIEVLRPLSVEPREARRRRARRR